MSKLITAFGPEEKKRGWKVEEFVGDVSVGADGKANLDISLLRLRNPSFGELSIGKTPGGWDGWLFHENGGGGSITLPYTTMMGQLYVGLVQQNRPNMGGPVWNMPGGFLDPGKTHFEMAKIEGQEELGIIDPNKRISPIPIGGQPKNANRAFFDTSGPDEGIKIYPFQVFRNELDIIPADKGFPTYKFKPGVVKPLDEKDKNIQSVMQCTFFHFTEALKNADFFVSGVVGILLAPLFMEQMQMIGRQGFETLAR